MRQFAIAVPLGVIRLYKAVVSPWLQRACRFTPTCSEYASESLVKHGFVRGLALSFWRILRCNPFCGHGYDPVPGSCKECQVK